MTAPPDPIEALFTTLADVEADAPTACAGWTAHELVAHLTAGVAESADLIEDAVEERPSRETRGFAEREAPYRDMPDEQLREVLHQETGRAVTAIGRLAERGPEASFEFTGATFTAEKLQVHAASEFAVHRWDLVGDDATSEALMSDPVFTEHAVDVLNRLPVLDEAPGQRAERAGLTDRRIVLRVAGARDVALTVDGSGTRFELGDEGSLRGDLVVAGDAVNRLLTLWGRHSNRREVTVTGDLSILDVAAAALWPTETEWPDRVRQMADTSSAPPALRS